MIGTPVEVPEELVPVEDLYLSLGTGKQVAVRCYRALLHGSANRPAISLDRAYSAKPLVLVDKQAVFPELAVLSLFRKRGWDGAWVDLAHRKYFDRMPNQSKGISLCAPASQAISRISHYSDDGRMGCWDLVLWAERTVAFAAVIAGAGAERRAGSVPAAEPSASVRALPAREIAAALGEPRLRWLGAAVKSGMNAGQFAVVQWGYRTVFVRRKGNPSVRP